MMTYVELLRNFKNDLERAMDTYDDDNGAAMPQHRVQDLQALRSAITQLQIDSDRLFSGEENEALLSAVTNSVEKFITGLYIPSIDQSKSLYPTGKSRLKDALETVINDPRYSKEAFLRARVRDLNQRLAVVDGIEPTAVLKLKQELDNATAQIATLSGTKKLLEIQNKNLQAENARLEAENARKISPRIHNQLMKEKNDLQKQVQALIGERDGLKNFIDVTAQVI